MLRTPKPAAALDIEIYGNYFLIRVRRIDDGKDAIFEESARKSIDKDRLRRVLAAHTLITFNGRGFDIPLIFYFLAGATVAQVKAAADRIIMARIPWWRVEEALDIRIPKSLIHYDLIEPQPNPIASLKTLNGRMHGRWLQDLPYDPSKILTFEEMDLVCEYCGNDLDVTISLYLFLEEPLDMRRIFTDDLGVDVMSKSDTQMGLAIIKSRVEKATGSRIGKAVVRPGTAFRYKVPDYIQFETPQLQDILARILAHEFVVLADGKVELPAFLSKAKIELGSSIYQMGIGGLHSTEANRAVVADGNYVLCDADVSGFYPQIILTLGLYPAAVGEVFLPVYGGIRADRMKAKRAKDKARDKGLKIAGNGIFGALGNQHLFVYAPHLLIAVTLTGQLALLMLIERAIRAGIDVVSGNTDGVVFRCPRDMFGGIAKTDEGKDTVRLNPCDLANIAGQWEADTGFELEFVQYKAIYNQSVNTYIAIKEDGGHKRKGSCANPWSAHPDDNDVRAQLMKNPQATICSDAVLALIKDGTPLEETIYNCTDIRQFVTVIKADGGATWRGQYLGKVVRYYWSTDGEAIYKAKGHPKTGNKPMVPKTEGAAPCMMLPDDLPDDIDYARYLAEAREILVDIGYSEPPDPPVKIPRLTKANTLGQLFYWAAAAA